MSASADTLVVSIARICAGLVLLAAGCGSTEAGEPAPPASATRVESATAPAVPELRGLTFTAAKERLRELDMTWRWIIIQQAGVSTEELEVCRQEPPAGAVEVTEATLALAANCDVTLPDLTGMALGDATKLLDANDIGWQLEDDIDIDFPASLDSAPPDWHVCGGDSYSGMLYGDGEGVIVFLQVAPDAASCYTTNDGEEP